MCTVEFGPGDALLVIRSEHQARADSPERHTISVAPELLFGEQAVPEKTTRITLITDVYILILTLQIGVMTLSTNVNIVRQSNDHIDFQYFIIIVYS
jgi:hypothetical protein